MGRWNHAVNPAINIYFSFDLFLVSYYLLMGRYPFRGDTIYLLLVNIDQGDIKWPDKNVSEDCLDFLKSNYLLY